MKNKKPILIIILAILTIIFIYGAFGDKGDDRASTDLSNKENTNSQDNNNNDSITNIIPEEYSIIAETIPENTFSTGEILQENNQMEFIKTEYYNANYYPDQNSITLVITRSPFEEIRIVAEENLMSKLNISKEKACTFEIKITTPRFVNPDQAGVVYDLSFCDRR